MHRFRSKVLLIESRRKDQLTTDRLYLFSFVITVAFFAACVASVIWPESY